jgi:cysteinyl-tRNA synthetase
MSKPGFHGSGRRRQAAVLGLAVWLTVAGAPAERATAAPSALGSGRGFPATCPWLSFYGTSRQLGNLPRVARHFRIINIDADPASGNFRGKDIAVLKRNGRNRVLSYLNVGACERFRDYWQTAPSGFLSCKDNRKAQRGSYGGYPDEIWMDPSDVDYQRLLLEVIAPRLAATGVDGFFLDNLEILEHEANTNNGPCDSRCRQGGLALVKKLRDAFPNHLIVMQNATSDVTRLARLATQTPDRQGETELVAWQALKLAPGQRKFFLGTEDYVGHCRAAKRARIIKRLSRARGFCPFVTDASAGQKVLCSWAFRK